ncbi:MAG TPA: DUF2911 domain-containing protein [Ohtaekwangia sp.]|nr:DUF2911 domain-containing protein [Ohtaekwangia sp.]
MKKFLIFSGIAVAVIVLLAWATFFFMIRETKSYSPEEEVVFNDGDVAVKVSYNRPYKKGRAIFGDLVPYDTVWRTGANEATTFETNTELQFEGKVLKKGKYTLWTIPRKDTWTVIFNSEFGQWGVSFDGQANRDPSRDVLSVDVHAVEQDREFEQFTISFEKVGEDAEMVLIWDKTLVAVPFSY